MAQRSRAEVVFLCHLIKAIKGKVSPDDVVNALLLGDRVHKTDGIVKLDGGLLVASEYDDGTYHSRDSDLVRDTNKTRKLLAHDSRMLVLRLRLDAPVLVGLEGEPRVVLVDVPSRSVGKAVAAVAASLATKLPEKYANRLRRVTDKEHSKAAMNVFHEVMKRVDQGYVDELEAVKALLGGDEALARKLLSTHGVKTRLATGSIADGVQWAKSLGMDGKMLLTFLSGCVVARISEPAFRAAVSTLSDAWNLSAKQTVTLFSTDSVASRIEQP
eukprot:6611648-Prymnesium_polylepis.1